MVKRKGKEGKEGNVGLSTILGVGLTGSQDLSGARRMRHASDSHSKRRVFPSKGEEFFPRIVSSSTWTQQGTERTLNRIIYIYI